MLVSPTSQTLANRESIRIAECKDEEQIAQEIGLFDVCFFGL